jgi:hypothetical protein
MTVYSNPTAKKYPILRVLAEHCRTLNQWVPGPVPHFVRNEDSRSDIEVSRGSALLTSVGTEFESWWVHETIVGGGWTIHKCILDKGLQKSPTKVGLFFCCVGRLITGLQSSAVKMQ